MDELLESKWYLDASGTKIITDSVDKYEIPICILAVSVTPIELLTHICHIHNEWLEDQWAAERFYEALERDD
jgi:hypothetical protein